MLGNGAPAERISNPLAARYHSTPWRWIFITEAAPTKYSLWSGGGMILGLEIAFPQWLFQLPNSTGLTSLLGLPIRSALRRRSCHRQRSRRETLIIRFRTSVRPPKGAWRQNVPPGCSRSANPLVASEQSLRWRASSHIVYYLQAFYLTRDFSGGRQESR